METGRDYIVYNGDGQSGDGGSKDVNVINLYISLIDGKQRGNVF